jgi:hypothetical protein
VGRLVRGRRVGGGRNIRRCVRGVLYVFDICSVCVLVLLWFTMYIRDLGWDRMGWGGYVEQTRAGWRFGTGGAGRKSLDGGYFW